MRLATFLWVLLLSVSLYNVLGEDDAEDENEYFYLTEPNSPVLEFALPPDQAVYKNHEFLFRPSPGVHRIVEFYAHWCPHCLAFRDHYIQFAKTLKTLAPRYNLQIETYAVSCVPHRPLCKEQGVTGYPKVKLFMAGSTNGTFIDPWDLHPFTILRRFGVTAEFEDLPEESPKSVPSHNFSTGEHFLPRSKPEIYNDAYLSFSFAMRNAIFIEPGPLKNNTKQAFSDFLQMLQATLPPTFRLGSMIAEIVSNMDEVMNSEEKLLAIVDKHPPKKKKWSHACSRGAPTGGYTCGLWELFHISSIGLVEWNSMVTGDDWSYYRPEESSEMLRNYIENFFQCEVCRLNFLHAYDACAHDRCNRLTKNVGEMDDWIEFPMWLFETHNGVNVRLMKEGAQEDNRKPTREDETAVQWPSRKYCPVCWHADGRWDQDKVYMYLRLTYWPDDELTEKHRKLLLPIQYDDEEDETSTNWLLYIFGAFILFSSVTWFKDRRRVIRTGRHKKVDGPTPSYSMEP